MTAQEYLQQAQGLNEEIENLSKELKEMKISLFGGQSVSFDSNSIPREHSGNSTEKAIIRFLEYEEFINAEIAKRLALRLEIEKAVNAVPNKKQRRVLYCKYLKNMEWGQIAYELGYSESSVFRIHGEALKNLIVNDSK